MPDADRDLIKVWQKMPVVQYPSHGGDGGAPVKLEPDWDVVAQPDPDYEVDQRVNW